MGFVRTYLCSLASRLPLFTLKERKKVLLVRVHDFLVVILMIVTVPNQENVNCYTGCYIYNINQNVPLLNTIFGPKIDKRSFITSIPLAVINLEPMKGPCNFSFVIFLCHQVQKVQRPTLQNALKHCKGFTLLASVYIKKSPQFYRNLRHG